jgi:hypothetical protein
MNRGVHHPDFLAICTEADSIVPEASIGIVIQRRGWDVLKDSALKLSPTRCFGQNWH